MLPFGANTSPAALSASIAAEAVTAVPAAAIADDAVKARRSICSCRGRQVVQSANKLDATSSSLGSQQAWPHGSRPFTGTDQSAVALVDCKAACR